MEVFRTYKNASADVLRIDTILMAELGSEMTTNPGKKSYRRDITISKVLESTDRVVDSIQLITDADTYDSAVSGASNFTWVAWVSHGGVRCDMSDLPVIGDTV